jgi:hypothetical protein
METHNDGINQQLRKAEASQLVGPLVKLFWQPSLFYVASAGLVLAGIGQVLSPVLGKNELTPEHMMSLGSMFGYEMAVFGVMLLIAVWKKVYDDAISLTLVIALFLVATPIALNTVAAPYPELAIALGGVIFALALVRVGVISSRVVGGISPSVILILAVYLLVGAVWPGALGKMVAMHKGDGQIMPVWLLGYGLVLGCSCLLPAVLVPDGVQAADKGKWDTTAFLKTYGMRWCFTAVLGLGAVVQFYAMAWAFGLKVPGVLMLPGVLPMLVAGMVLARAYGEKMNAGMYILAGVPVAAVMVLGVFSARMPEDAGAMGMVLSPGTLLACLGAVITFLGYRMAPGARGLYAIGPVTSALGLVIVARYFFEGDFGQAMAGMCLVGSLLWAGWVLRSAWPAVAGCAVAGAMAMGLAEMAGYHSPLALMLGVLAAGMGMSGLVCVMGDKAGVKLTWLTLLTTSVSGFYIAGVADAPTWMAVLAALMVPVSGVLIGLRTNYWLLAVLALVPGACLVRYMPAVGAGWVMLGGGFVLLGLGLVASLTKERWREAVHSGEPPHAIGGERGDGDPPV